METSNLGSSLVFPSVKDLAKEGLTKVPERYVHSDIDPPIVCHKEPLPELPVIDLNKLYSEEQNGPELEKLGLACKEWGFFQVIKNGIYKSTKHRAVVNSQAERLSSATFYGPEWSGNIGPLPSLVTLERSALFKTICIADFYKGYVEHHGESYINDVLRIQNENIG